MPQHGDSDSESTRSSNDEAPSIEKKGPKKSSSSSTSNGTSKNIRSNASNSSSKGNMGTINRTKFSVAKGKAATAPLKSSPVKSTMASSSDSDSDSSTNSTNSSNAAAQKKMLGARALQLAKARQMAKKKVKMSATAPSKIRQQEMSEDEKLDAFIEAGGNPFEKPPPNFVVHEDDERGLTSLMYAATQFDTTSLLEMIDSGYAEASLFVKDAKGRTALDWARIARNELAIAILTKAMTEFITKSRKQIIDGKFDKENAAKESNLLQSKLLLKSLHASDEDAAIDALTNNVEGRGEGDGTGGVVFRDQVESFGEVYFTDIPDSLGSTPLMLAAGRNMVEVVYKLLDMGVNIDAGNKHGHNPLVWASICGHNEVIKALLFRGANINHITGEGRNCLHYTCQYAKPKAAAVIIDYLIEKFQTFRLDHPKLKPDPTRWSKYAKILDDFMNIKDKNGLKAYDLLPKFDKEASTAYSVESISTEENASEIINEASVRSLKSKTSFAHILKDEEVRDDILPIHPSMEISLTTLVGKESTDQLVPYDAAGGDAASFDELSSMRDDISQLSFGYNGEELFESEEDKELKPESVENIAGSSQGRPGTVASFKSRPGSTMNMSRPSTRPFTGASGMSLPSVDTDDFLAGLHGINDSHALLNVVSGTVDIASVEDVFRRANTRIRQWRIATEKEKDFQAEVECWQGCGFVGRFDDLIYHMKRDCTHRLLLCPDCKEYEKAYLFNEHRNSQCHMRICACPNAAKGCGELLRHYTIERHLKLRCQFRPITCRMNCGATPPFKFLLDHEENHCCMRLIECGVCDEKVVSKNLAHHRHNECLNRMVKCRTSCGSLVMFKDLDYHENHVCRAPCKYNCGQVIGPAAARTHHELNLCENRPRECSFGCGIKGLTAKYYEEHQLYQCPRAIIPCPNNCGRTIERRELNEHNSPLGVDKCPERMIQCPSNLVGWRILFLKKNVDDNSMPSSEPGLVLKFDRQISDKTVITSRHDAHGVDRIFVRFARRHQWLNVWDSNIIPVERLSRDACEDCGWMTWSNLNNHLNNSCMNRPVPVATDSDRKMTKTLPGNNEIPLCIEIGSPEARDGMGIVTLSSPKLNNMADENPLPNMKPGQVMDFRNAHNLATRRVQFENFLNAPPQQVSCPQCGFIIDREHLHKHRTESCPKIFKWCPLGCGRKIVQPDIENHIATECGKRNLTCQLCKEPVWADEMDEHVKNECLSRPKECALKCGTEGITFRNEEEHLVHHCPNRMIECTCGDKMPFCEHEDHVIADCPKKLNICPQGCGQMVPRDTMDLHMKKLCPSKEAWARQMINCPARCGTRIMRRDFLEHISYKCPYRLSECPLHCGNYLKFDKMKLHIFFCPMRPTCCQPGMKSCERLFHRWFTPICASVDDKGDFQVYNNGARDMGSTEQVASVSFASEYNDDEISLGDKSAGSFNRGLNTSTLTIGDASSVEYDGSKVIMKDDIRMRPCERHGSTILMYAIKADEYILTEYILRATKNKDINHENEFGHTALTIAAKMGKLRFVKLLLQAGADFAYETKSGNTALIEAVKSENEAVVDTLLRAGALAREKTVKHHRSALQWSQTLKLRMIERNLDIYGVVQAQVHEIFRLIGSGDIAKVKSLVADGDFYDPCNQEKVEKMLHDVYEERDTLTEQTEVLQKASFDAKQDLDNAQAYHDDLLAQAEGHDARCLEIAKEVKKAESEVQKAFSKYEGACSKVERGDLEELVRNIKPDKPVILAVLIFGIMYNVLDPDLSIVYHIELSSSNFKDWWKRIMLVMFNSEDTMKRLKGFSLGKLNGKHGEMLLTRAREVYKQLEKARLSQDKGLDDEEDEETEEGGDKITELRSKRDNWDAPPTARSAREMGIPKNAPRYTYEGAKWVQLFDEDEQHHYWYCPATKAAQWEKPGEILTKRDDYDLPPTARSARDSEGYLNIPKDAPKMMFQGHKWYNVWDPGERAYYWYCPTTKAAQWEQPGGGVGEASARSLNEGGAEMSARSQSKTKRDNYDPPPSARSAKDHSRLLPDAERFIHEGKEWVQVWDPVEAAHYWYCIATEEACWDKPGTESESARDALRDEDWDSDADEAVGGNWVKGEWVPIVHKRKNWWEDRPKGKEARQKLKEELNPPIVEDRSDIEANAKYGKPRYDIVIVDPEFKMNASGGFVRAATPSVARPDTSSRPGTTFTDYTAITNDGDNISRPNTSVTAYTTATDETFSRPGTGFRPNTVNTVGTSRPGTTATGFRPNTAVDSEDGYSTRPSTTYNQQSRPVTTVSFAEDKSRPGTSVSFDISRPGTSMRPNTAENIEFGNEMMNATMDDRIDDNFDEEYQSPLFVKAMVKLVETAEDYAAVQPMVRKARADTIAAQEAKKECLEMLFEAKQELDVLHEKQKIAENNLIRNIKESKRAMDRIKLYKSKVRIARLLNHVTQSGHTAISWAASYGEYDIVEELLSRGGTVGYTREMIHLSVAVIQHSYRIYRFIHTAKASLSEVNPLDAALEAKSMDLLEQIELVKEERRIVIQQVQWRRRVHRLPLVEAGYRGHWEIIKRIHERRLFHLKFSHAWNFPRPHAPFMVKREHTEITKGINLMQVLAYGMSDIAAGGYVPTEGGWTQPGGHNDQYGVAFEEIKTVLDKVNAAATEYRAARHRKRLVVVETRNQKKGAEEMTQAIIAYNFKECMRLAQERAISIDTEINIPGSNQDGETCLLKASEENAGAVNHVFMINDDEEPVLQVAYLLDRETYSPNVNQENKFGVTPIMRACAAGRPHVLQALLDRGAEPNYVNKFNETALHYAVRVGNTDCVRTLLERGIDLNLKDQNGKTAYDIASDNGFTYTMGQINRYAGGNWGKVALSRGGVDEHITCPNGCGKAIFPYDAKEHNENCPCRTVVCPNGCGMPRIMFKSLQEHMSMECSHTMTMCELCHKNTPIKDLEDHMTRTCENRRVPCGMCGDPVPFQTFREHLTICPRKAKPCPNECGEMICTAIELDHLNKECSLRRVECPLRCSALVTAKNLKNHLTSQCPKRPTQCKFCGFGCREEERLVHVITCEEREIECKCGAFVNHKYMKEHYKNDCKHRFIPCRLKCGQKVREVDMDVHCEKECGNRLVECPLRCMTVTLEGKVVTMLTHRTVEKHLQFECKMRDSKCALCGEAVPVPDIDIHRTNYCQQRMVGCRIGRCQRTMPFVDREHHERFTCRHRKIICPQGCGECIIAMHAGKHMRDNCSWRLIECPLKCGVDNLRGYKLDEHLNNECVRRDRTSVPTSPSFSGGKSVGLPSTMSPPGSPNKGGINEPGTPLSRSKDKRSTLVQPMEIVGEPNQMPKELAGISPLKDDGELKLKR